MEQVNSLIKSALDASKVENAMSDLIHFSSNEMCLPDGSRVSLLDRRLFLVGAGKASARMALSLQSLLSDAGFSIEKGVILTAEGQSIPKETAEKLGILSASHPLPSEENVAGTERMISLLSSMNPSTDLCFFLISGGASSMLSAPRCSLAELREVNQALLHSGADIAAVNAVRKRLSRVKGGQLAALYNNGTPSYSFICSDVIGSPLDAIGSGPTCLDASSAEEASRLFDEICPASLKSRLSLALTIQDAAKLSHVQNFLILDNRRGLAAMQAEAGRLQFSKVESLGAELDGEAADVGRLLVERIFEFSRGVKGNCALLAAGETTVTIDASSKVGSGGRNQELCLAAAIEFERRRRQNLSEEDDNSIYYIASIGSDGADHGPAAGAVVHSEQFLGGDSALYEEAEAALREHDSAGFYSSKMESVQYFTGPTGTNVADFMLCVRLDKTSMNE